MTTSTFIHRRTSWQVLLACFGLCLQLWPHPLPAAERHIDAARSTITIHVGKTGLFSAAGHEHEVSAPIEQGAIDDSGPGSVRFTVHAASLMVMPEADQAEVQKTMQSTVLESAKFPEIKFESTSVRSVGEGKWTVTGNLALHGVTKPVTVEVQKGSDGYTGESRIKQTGFGIKPVTAAGGAVKVKDELRIDFRVVAK
jgi:polyisoprenoid-binding protein YceI